MKATIRFGNVSIEVEGEKQKDVFQGLASVQEVFSHSKCGKCGNEDLRYIVREVKDNSFYELHCQNTKCRARFVFGQHKGSEGTLFPRRKAGENDASGLEQGTWLPDGGWMRFNKETNKEE